MHPLDKRLVVFLGGSVGVLGAHTDTCPLACPSANRFPSGYHAPDVTRCKDGRGGCGGSPAPRNYNRTGRTGMVLVLKERSTFFSFVS